MKIRVINESDWEKSYEFDKAIVRVGSQASCDIQLKGTGIQPLQLQLVRAAGSTSGYVMRIFADNVTFSRGEQTFPAEKMVPYDVIDGDKIRFGPYRVVITLDEGQTRVRQSAHIEAEMFLSRKELTPDAAINGILVLKNIGTEKPCQFRMKISGIPDECLKSSPLPYIYPGGSSSVGFVISHLQTKPEPGFRTVSITVTAPEEYSGEFLEFNQDIYIAPVFQNEFLLEDDSSELTGFKTVGRSEDAKPAGSVDYVPGLVPDPSSILGDEASAEKDTGSSDGPAPVVVKSGNDFEDIGEEEEEASESGTPRRKSRRPSIVFHHGDEGFEGEEPDKNAESDAEDTGTVPEAAIIPEAETETEPEAVGSVPEPAEPETADEPDVKPAEKPERKRRKSGSGEESSGLKHGRRAAKSGSKSDDSAKPADHSEEKPAEAPEPAKEPKPKKTAKNKPAETPKEKEPLPEKDEKAAELPVPEEAPGNDEVKKAEETPSEEPDVTEFSAVSAEELPETPAPESAEVVPESLPEEESETVPEEEPSVPETAVILELSGSAEIHAEPEPKIPVEPSAPEGEKEAAVPQPEKSDAEQEAVTEIPAETAPVETPKAEVLPDTETGADKVVLRGQSTVPVIHSAGSMDFGDESDTESEAEAPDAWQPETVRFVKGGQFDD